MAQGKTAAHPAQGRSKKSYVKKIGKKTFKEHAAQFEREASGCCCPRALLASNVSSHLVGRAALHSRLGGPAYSAGGLAGGDGLPDQAAG
jgi:hypothetical protein